MVAFISTSTSVHAHHFRARARDIHVKWTWCTTGAYLHSANCADNTPKRQICFINDLRLLLPAYCRDACAKYINGNQGDIQGYVNASLLVNWPEDLSSFHSLMCKNNVLLDYLLSSLANIHSHACFTLADPTPRFASDVVGGKLGRHNVHRAVCEVTMDWPWNGIAVTHREILWRKTTRYITVQLATGSLHDNAKMLLVSTIGCLPAKKN